MMIDQKLLRRNELQQNAKLVLQREQILKEYDMMMRQRDEFRNRLQECQKELDSLNIQLNEIENYEEINTNQGNQVKRLRIVLYKERKKKQQYYERMKNTEEELELNQASLQSALQMYKSLTLKSEQDNNQSERVIANLREENAYLRHKLELWGCITDKNEEINQQGENRGQFEREQTQRLKEQLKALHQIVQLMEQCQTKDVNEYSKELQELRMENKKQAQHYRSKQQGYKQKLLLLQQQMRSMKASMQERDENKRVLQMNQKRQIKEIKNQRYHNTWHTLIDKERRSSCMEQKIKKVKIMFKLKGIVAQIRILKHQLLRLKQNIQKQIKNIIQQLRASIKLMVIYLNGNIFCNLWNPNSSYFRLGKESLENINSKCKNIINHNKYSTNRISLILRQN